jgi:hypothetical protein
MVVSGHQDPKQVASDPLERHQHSLFNFEKERVYNPNMNLNLKDVP